LDFLLESQAREYPEDFMKVLRAQWIGDALGEEDVSIRHYGKGGGFWDGLAFYKKRAIVVDAEAVALGKELAKLSIDLPFSLGMWEDTKPVTIDLREGRNTLMLTCRAPNRGVSLKHFKLKPVE